VRHTGLKSGSCKGSKATAARQPSAKAASLSAKLLPKAMIQRRFI
jgi:hypothetical protein